jgi:hypothetical protein
MWLRHFFNKKNSLVMEKAKKTNEWIMQKSLVDI